MYPRAITWCSLLLLLTDMKASSSSVDIFANTTLSRCRTVLDAWCSDESRYCFDGTADRHCSTSLHASLSSKGWVCQTVDAACSCPAHQQLKHLLYLCANDLTAVDVFVPGESSINTYRIPAIVQTNKGTLLAFAEGRMYDSNDCHRKLIVMKRSENAGMTWGKLQIVPLGVSDNRLVSGNPQPVFDYVTNSTLLQFVTNENTTQQCDPGRDNWLITSTDDGMTWGGLTKINTFLGNYTGLLPGPGGAIQLTKTHPGRIVFAGHYGSYEYDVVWYSDDHGHTFQRSETVLQLMDEPQIVELTNGSLLLNMRNRHQTECACRALARSDDGGATWGDIHYDATLISPICQASLVRINNAFYFSNPASKTARENLTIRMSADNCDNWKSKLLIGGGPVAGGYSNIVPAPLAGDSTKGGILYERYNVVNGTKRAVISFTQFPLQF